MLSLFDPLTNQTTPIQKGRLLILQSGTWEDYWSLSNEDTKVEFIGDLIFIQSPATLDHELIFGEILGLFKQFLKVNPVGKIIGSRFPIRLKDGKRAEPDLFFISQKDIDRGNLTKTIFEGSPSVIIEIVSPSYRNHDTETKFNEYKKLGVREYIIIDPEMREIRQYLFDNFEIQDQKSYFEGKIVFQTTQISELTIDVDELWKLLS